MYYRIALATYDNGHVLATVGVDQRIYWTTGTKLVPMTFHSGFRHLIRRVAVALSRAGEMQLFMVTDSNEVFGVRCHIGNLLTISHAPKRWLGMSDVSICVDFYFVGFYSTLSGCACLH